MEILSAKNFLEQAKFGVIIDVRSPSEYLKGHIPNSFNIPIFNDAERAIVGTIYKKESKEVAIEKGLEIVGPKMANFVREAKAISKGARIYIYCWRGGMRSGSMAWLFETAGLPVTKLEKGYKGFRNYGLDILESLANKFIVLSGHTGSGKTEILHELANLGEQVLDLEGLANHRGSVFGGFGMGKQPTSEHFTNLVFEKLSEFSQDKHIWCENESIAIGHIYMLQELFNVVSSSPIININIPLSVRIERLVKEYGAFDKEMYLNAFEKITKRLGGDNVTLAKKYIEEGDLTKAAEIALHYYDKGYTKSTQKSKHPLFDNISLESGDPSMNAKIILDRFNELK